MNELIVIVLTITRFEEIARKGAVHEFKSLWRSYGCYIYILGI